ncbi:CUB and zona pellucida-like domain-containing protein 1 [Mizuhopecten yessoensis]|uniref:CUB and zona pellucida-like domain-containing protein 1 n=1 Tax=Mizuhopecten yessoensis TaxID=6573 RepID=A0A210QZR7_MIZYE|nr:CUB and zona pellucida-like domain-containing protein 1 [Mizuhopecten yessoensis]OWF54227.1 CUB and zona pellucida-like domain-containing protein 1 [Mizuhopecten yessoensis]
MEAVKFLLIFVFFTIMHVPTADMRTAVPTADMRTNDSVKSVSAALTAEMRTDAYVKKDENSVGYTNGDTRKERTNRRREDCGPGDLYGPSATIESPYNPGYYHLYYHCYWTMHVPPNTTVRLTFERFDLYTGHDYVTVYDGSRNVTGKLTGFIHVPYYVDSTGDIMRVEYVTDIAFTTNGFKASLQEIDKEVTTADYGRPTTENPVTITDTAAPHYSSDMYVSAITVACYPDAWDIRIYLPNLYKRHSDFDPSDIYLGEPGCGGYRSGNYLVVHQQYSKCETHLMITSTKMEYTNTLIYAYRDATYKFIVRDYRFKIDVECDIATHETVSQHFIETHNKVRTRSNNPHVSGSGHYNVHMSFYSDSSYQQQLTGSSLTVNIGDDIYVSVTTPLSDSDVKIRVESCYTLPSLSAGDEFKLYLIRNGCSSDVNTHVRNTSSHETRFVFRDFEYSGRNQDDLYLFCTVTFCNVTDHSSACDQSCHKVRTRSVQSASTTHLRTADTSDVLHLSKDRLRRDVGKLDDVEITGHAQSVRFPDHLLIAVVISALGILAIGMFVAIRRYRKRKSGPNDTL